MLQYQLWMFYGYALWMNDMMLLWWISKWCTLLYLWLYWYIYDESCDIWWMALLDRIVMPINCWCLDPPPYCQKLGFDRPPSSILDETSSSLQVLLGRVKPVWASAQGDRAGWVSTKWEPLSMRLFWWVLANKWFCCWDLVMTKEEDMLCIQWN